MATPTDDNPNLLTVVARMTAKPGREADLRSALEALVNWESGSKLDAHLRAEHLVDYAAKLEDLLAGGSEGLVIQRLERIK